MSKILATIHLFGIGLVDDARQRLADKDEEAGHVSLETVVITAAVLIAAIALIAIITNAISNRASAIS